MGRAAGRAGRGDLDRAPALGGLGLAEPPAAVHPHQRVVDADVACLPVEVVPAQCEQLALAHAGRHRQHKQRFERVILGGRQEAPRLLRRRRPHLGGDAAGEGRARRRIAATNASPTSNRGSSGSSSPTRSRSAPAPPDNIYVLSTAQTLADSIRHISPTPPSRRSSRARTSCFSDGARELSRRLAR